ncbi:DeoR family transcriptional regulator [Streptomyces sp. NBRC 14336]|uniref:dienelactone hydrolase family protein n=1 Tax=Streptomyces sp. NBRC 14336 TaxID=3030992 RepID=UPI0024A1D24E|nr:alpha/beta family hydrolase [Streptomyces sp. NBRC 14336]WBO76545.1 dienelactone hydrolase family protein [Streptomyces sp. SBE_14.2]GLW47006.1 DeoR family transcriptional regulator [Streptomyces sp. NBRC 14336]
MISRAVVVPAGRDVELAGELVLPSRARAVVLFAHGSGSSRHSPRNRKVAQALHGVGLGTLLMDLLSEEEAREDEITRAYRFDIPLLGGRLVAAIDWLAEREETRNLLVALFGASTGAAAALVAAAERPARVLTVVSRGGRPDLAEGALEAVHAPVLLIVGGRDLEVMRLNEDAARRLRVPCTVHVVSGATHLFQEPGALETVADAARQWCADHVRAAAGD